MSVEKVTENGYTLQCCIKTPFCRKTHVYERSLPYTYLCYRCKLSTMVSFSASVSEASTCSWRCAALRLMNLLCFENSLHKPQMPKCSQSCSRFLGESFPSSRSTIYSVAFLQVICKLIRFIKNYPVKG